MRHLFTHSLKVRHVILQPAGLPPIVHAAVRGDYVGEHADTEDSLAGHEDVVGQDIGAMDADAQAFLVVVPAARVGGDGLTCPSFSVCWMRSGGPCLDTLKKSDHLIAQLQLQCCLAETFWKVGDGEARGWVEGVTWVGRELELGIALFWGAHSCNMPCPAQFNPRETFPEPALPS